MSETQPERVIWQAFPSWSHFSWLYFFVLLTVFRVVLFLYVGLPGWPIWVTSACVLLLVVVLIRRWAYYVLTPTRVIMMNGYTHHEIAVMRLEAIQRIEMRQGPIARYWGIGTLVIRSSKSDQELQLRGVKDPDVVLAKIHALMPTLRGQ